ncbi:MAG: protein kinase [Deltaproteobacteria bacterium]|nr:MAG: protein kinase [Deltaproteobacteria bacterium]
MLADDLGPRGAVTPRDQLDRIVALVRRALRYWWVAALVAVAGTALTVGAALLKVDRYESASVIMYQEVISAQLLLGSSLAGERSRGMALRFEEMTRARPLLEQVIEEHGLFSDLIQSEGMSAAIEEMRKRIGFRAGGGGTFTISYRGDTREQAQAVTASLADHLIAWERELQRKRASTTKEFLANQRDQVEKDLQQRERDLAAFLRDHPEFATETVANTAGAGVRAARESRRAGESDPTLRALERQRNRIRARLEAGTAPPSPREASNPAVVEAERALRAAERELDQARRDLERKQARFTDKHPDVVFAKSQVAAAERRVAQARADLAQARGAPAVAPASEEDVAKLREELDDIEKKIASYKRRARRERSEADADDAAREVDEIVLLETEHQRLRREVDELRERYQAIEAKAFTAEIAAASEAAVQGSHLAVIEPAYRPTRPVGVSRTKLVLAGMIAFSGIGAAVAFALALVDDRIVSKYDVERLDLLPVLVVVPPGDRRRRGEV